MHLKPDQFTHTLAESTVLAGQFEVVRKLGEGGMGEVHLAKDRYLNNRLVAVKILPALRVADRMVKLAKSRDSDKETRAFARKHIEEASTLIDAVGFRRGRLLEVANAIVEKQRAFFEIGPQGLGVLRMSDLAVELGCDPSTISRTVAGKYMQTPRGFYPLRYFFTGGTDAGNGRETSWDSVKERVRELIAEENREKPYSDEQVAKLLEGEGIELSRRTVAKYRQQLEIPAARQRRQF